MVRNGLGPGAVESREVIGEYRVTGVLGRGGMGTVYAGVHRTLEKPVAIKVLHKRDGLDRFIQEARLVNRIGHPNIVDIFDFGSLEDGSPYLVMEMLAGRPLSAFLDERAPLAYAEALPILCGIGRALEAGHNLGIVHRDLKPDNVFIEEHPDREPDIKVLDFGIAKPPPGDTDWRNKTRSGITIGSPRYMSPEQCAGAKEIDLRADVYSFGVVAYVIFTGRLPFDSESTADLLYSHLRAKPLRPSFISGVPFALEAIILRALEKRPEDRYPQLSDLLDDLASLPAEVRSWRPPSRQASARSYGDGPPTEALEAPKAPEARRGRSFVAGFALGILAALAAAAVGVAAYHGSGGPIPKPLTISGSAESLPARAARAPSWFRAPAAAKPAGKARTPVDLYEDW